MSADAHDDPTDDARTNAPVGTIQDEFPQPAAHGGGFQVVINDYGPRDGERNPYQRETLYNTVLDTWRSEVGTRENEGREGYELVADFEADWLPDDDRAERYAILLTSSGWTAGHGVGANYTQYYDYNLKLRRVTTDPKTGEPQYRNPPLSCYVKIAPQYHDLVYEDGNPYAIPYGPGTRATISTTWAETSDDAYQRLWDVLTAAFGPDAVDPTDANPESKKLEKAEAHSRVDVAKKNALVDTLNDSEDLIAYGGNSEIDASRERERNGWIEAAVSSDRWEHLGFDEHPFETKVKVYQRGDWSKRPDSDPFHHPKIEAAYNGVTSGALPHADDYQDVLDHLRTIVATHCRWAGVTREDLIADDFQDGPAAELFGFDRPEGRRDMLRRKYEDTATEIYREALKESTESVYDILSVVAIETGASYETLKEQTGLAKSTIRYHVRRLEDHGVLARLGNPTLVVFESNALLDDAKDILKQAKPGDTPEDREERAEERRERRENQWEANTPSQSDGGEESGSGNVWRYLDEWDGTPRLLVEEIAAGTRSERDVRVRILDDPPNR